MSMVRSLPSAPRAAPKETASSGKIFGGSGMAHSQLTSVDFRCRKCGMADCHVAPEDGSGAICPDCCEDHDYVYDRWDGHYCKHCGDPRPADYYSD